MNNKYYTFLIFLLNPFIGALYALYDLKNNKNIAAFLWLLFSFFYGYFLIGTNGGDFITYMGRFHEVSLLNLNQLLNYLSNKLDYLHYIFLYSLSIFTDDESILWGLVSLTFGYVVLKTFQNIHLFEGDRNITNPTLHKLTFFTLVFITSLYLIYNFRFWISVSLIYLGLTYYILGKKNRMLLCFLFASFTHFGAIPLVLVIFIGTYIRTNIYVLAFVSLLSIPIGQLELKAIIDYIPDYIMDSRAGYFTFEKIDGYRLYRETVNWYVFGIEKTLYYTSFFYILMNLRKFMFIKNKKIIGLISVTLMVYTFANLLIYLPLSERFTRVALFMGVLIVCLSSSLLIKFKYKPFIYMFCLAFILVELRKITSSLNLGLVLPTGVPSLLIDETSVFSFIFG